MRVYICACDNTYGGLHGMSDWCVTDVSSIDEANEIGLQMSYDVMESYDSITEYLESEADQWYERDTDEWQEAYEEAAMENTSWNVWEIDEEATKGLTNEELEELIECYEDEDFIKKYCIT